MQSSSVRTKLKSGQRPVQKNIRNLKAGDILFEEGSLGHELFVIEEGAIGVYKNTPDGEIELARVGKGSIIGEMSLLDHQPRSATVRAVEPARALVINETVFKAVLQKTPVWLTSIIKIVVSRLRDANRRVDQSVLRDKERGLVSLVLLLLPEFKHEFGSGIALDFDLVLLETYYVCRLKKKEIVSLLECLKKRQLVEIEEDSEKKKHVCIRDFEALQLFSEYLYLKSQQKKFKEIGIPEEAITAMSNIAYVAQKSGTQTAEGTQVSKAAVESDFSGHDRDTFEKMLLDLRRRGLVNLVPEGDDTIIVFNKETLSRIKKIKEWLPRFEMKPS